MAESSLKEKRARRRRRKREEREGTSETVAESADKSITEKKGRATPSRRKGEVGEHESGNAVLRFFGGIVEYFEGVRSELEKVTWPTPEETRRLSYIVALATLASAVVLGGLSIIFTELFNIGVDQPIVFLGVFILFLALLFGYARYTSRSSSSY